MLVHTGHPAHATAGPKLVVHRRGGAGVSSTARWCGGPRRPPGCDDGRMAPGPRFLTLTDVAEVLNTSSAQVYALVRRGELPAIKIGGRGQWRVERAKLEEYIQQKYAETASWVRDNPLTDPS